MFLNCGGLKTAHSSGLHGTKPDTSPATPSSLKYCLNNLCLTSLPTLQYIKLRLHLLLVRHGLPWPPPVLSAHTEAQSHLPGALAALLLAAGAFENASLQESLLQASACLAHPTQAKVQSCLPAAVAARWAATWRLWCTSSQRSIQGPLMVVSKSLSSAEHILGTQLSPNLLVGHSWRHSTQAARWYEHMANGSLIPKQQSICYVKHPTLQRLLQLEGLRAPSAFLAASSTSALLSALMAPFCMGVRSCSAQPLQSTWTH